jgi:hypothetical protein
LQAVLGSERYCQAKGSSSFLQKRTKKLLLMKATLQEAKVFASFFKKKRFLPY